MLRSPLPILALTFALLAPAWSGIGTVSVRAEEDPRTALEFVHALREKGYFDLASDYLDLLRAEKGTPEEIRVVLDYEFGRLLIDEASRSGDLVRRKELLEQARGRLEAFTKDHPGHELASEALVELARLLVERGHLAVMFAEDADDKAEKQAKLIEARTSFDQAREAYKKADERLKEEFKSFPNFLDDQDPRKPRRDRTHHAMMAAELQKAIVDYEEGQTYPVGSKERKEYLASGLAQFEDLYKNYRTQMAGLTARMWQAKCYEERGDIGPALGIYNELLGHDAPQLRPLQRHVDYFKIIAHGKRKEYALAADESVRWLQKFNTPEERHSPEGLGVQFELARNIVAQLPGIKRPADREKAVKRITDVLGEVVRYSSPFKSEAVALLQQYKPKVALDAMRVANLNYEDAIAQSDAGDRLPRVGPRHRPAHPGHPPRRPEEGHRQGELRPLQPGLLLLHEQAVLRGRRPLRAPGPAISPGGLSSKATEIGMASLADAYNTFRDIDRASDLNRLIDLATYTTETWPDNEQGDGARMVLGQIYHGFGQYPKAIEAYNAVRSNSAKWVDAQTRVGASHWEQSKVLRAKGTPEAGKEADAEVDKALGSLKAALKARQDSGNAAADPGLISNACDIADIYLETDRGDDALKLLDPIAKANPPSASPAYGRLMSDLLRAHVATNRVNLAMADMAALEKSGAGGGSLAQLYFSLGKLLEKEMNRLEEKGDSAGLNRTRQSYQKFLEALVASKTGQTYESLEWAGESMLTLDKDKEAAAVFEKILETYGKDASFLAAEGGRQRMLRTRLKQAAVLRGLGDFKAADALVEELIKESPRFDRAPLREGDAPRGEGRGQTGDLGRRLQPLEEPRPPARRHAPQAPRLLRRLVSHRPGALQGRQAGRGQEDPRQRHAAVGPRRQPRDQGQVQRPAGADQVRLRPDGTSIPTAERRVVS